MTDNERREAEDTVEEQVKRLGDKYSYFGNDEVWELGLACYAAACEAKREEISLLTQSLDLSRSSNSFELDLERARSAKLIEALKVIATHSNQFFIRFGADKAIAEYRAQP